MHRIITSTGLRANSVLNSNVMSPNNLKLPPLSPEKKV